MSSLCSSSGGSSTGKTRRLIVGSANAATPSGRNNGKMCVCSNSACVW